MPAAAPILQVQAKETFDLPLELQLLCLSARTSAPAKTKERIRELLTSARLDWTEVIRQAEWHGTAPLLAMNLAQQGLQIPDQAAGQLREICRTTAQQSLLLAAELLRVLKALKAAGVIAVPYKGPALAAAVYGNTGLRRSGDLDLLLCHASLEPAKKVLKEIGYVPCLALSAEQESKYARAQGALDFINPENNIALDLHCGIAPRHFAVAMPLELLLERAIQIPFAGSQVLMLQPEDLVLVLCIHGGKHGWNRLGWICDLSQTLFVYPQLDWRLVLRRADAAGLRRMLLLGLMLAETLLEAPVPADVKALLLADRALPGLADQAITWLKRGGVDTDAPRWLCLLRARERDRD